MALARRQIFAALIGLAGAAALVGAATPGTGRIQAAPNRAVLRILDLSPLVVRGTQFKSNERVYVVAAVPGPNLRRFVRASSTGRFTLDFRRTIACSTGFVVAASGRLGSVAGCLVPPWGIVPEPSCARSAGRDRACVG